MSRARQIADFGDGIATADIDDGAVTAGKLNSAVALGITHKTHFRLTANFTPGDSNVVIPSTNIEVVDDASYSSLGTEVTHSSGVYSLPVTGLWWVIVSASISSSTDNFVGCKVQATQDNGSNWDQLNEVYDGGRHDGGNSGGSNMTAFNFVNITNTATDKIRFVSDSFDSGSKYNGATTETRTSFIFMRIGDAQS